MMKSALAEAMQNSNTSDFVLQAPDKRLPNYLKCKIYFFETKKNITIEVSSSDRAGDVLRHIMTLYKHNEALNTHNPLQHPDSPERYQLFLIDEDDSDIEVEYDMGPRNVDEAIGEFEKLAFVENRNYKSQSAAEDEFLESQSETLEADGKRLIHVYCNTVIVNSSNFSIPMDNTDRIQNIFQLISKKTGRDKFNSKKYVIMI